MIYFICRDKGVVLFQQALGNGDIFRRLYLHKQRLWTPTSKVRLARGSASIAFGNPNARSLRPPLVRENPKTPAKQSLAKEVKRKIKGVIYARYSSDNQREESIEGQIRECKAFADKNGIDIIEIYIDRALSAKTDNRPDFQRLIKESGSKKFEVLLVWKLD